MSDWFHDFLLGFLIAALTLVVLPMLGYSLAKAASYGWRMGALRFRQQQNSNQKEIERGNATRKGPEREPADECT